MVRKIQFVCLQDQHLSTQQVKNCETFSVCTVFHLKSFSICATLGAQNTNKL